MRSPTHPFRPATMRIDFMRCTRCGLCKELAPLFFNDSSFATGGAIAVQPKSLQAMAQCPTGAIVWNEQPLADGAGHP